MLSILDSIIYDQLGLIGSIREKGNLSQLDQLICP